ncbi:DUF5343 domain-containing protein [Rhizobium sp. 18065]|uniref:DUF5343 domain-containing protein n=1 Tax=Rhizobium sp. 18065 TaxID=2681411 RepID=UPI00135CF5BA|nr:DUF5343 domain-containing protein [Rhizobium sp. 18065]
MPVTTESPGPYAPASAIIGLIERHRNKGLPSPVDGEVLGRAGISDSLIQRTLQAMQTLGLLDEDKRPTDTLEGLRKAPESDYKIRIIEWLNIAYADALAFIEPGTADETDIRDAFRSYKPVGQQDRMVTLFIGLYTYAGARSERAARQAPVRKGVPTKPVPITRSARQPVSLSSRLPGVPSSVAPLGMNALPPALAGLLASLPPQGESWTNERREAFVKTFSAVLDFCYPTVLSDNRNNKAFEEERE